MSTTLNCAGTFVPGVSSDWFLTSFDSARKLSVWPKVGMSSYRRGVRVNSTLVTGTSQDHSSELMNLGRTSLQISKLGTGTLQWGDPGSGYGKSYREEDLAEAFDTLVQGGVNFFDTAEVLVYGYQGIKSGTSSEQLLGKFIRRPSGNTGSPSLTPVIASKFFTIPWTNFLVGGGFRLGRESLLAALKESLKRTGREQIDLYQIHFPFPTFSNSALMESLKEAVEMGLTKAVGVSNYSRDQMEEADDLLAKYNIPLASNQVQFSLLCQTPIEDGLLRVCRERCITLIAYSPLASGVLSEKTFTRTDSRSVQVQPLLKLMQTIGANHGGKSITQVALNYLICKGALPIPGCKSAELARLQLGVLGWRLEDAEVALLEQRKRDLKL
ncbi:hypothetical protein AXG93_3661s1300 [Marchantia polymorpha subsp. ruderalis]|uniref:NADP-dependent oxidoreductase domain-containing protein n=1 Tax=Marchantia polymorpha subsp. ruderalis TaxID=1480154 RepID=A0A176VMD5_MARPO|nr:hypothetical protein AXG93_3661s1300 [Marchantia polymorpha subsp. ruderalis]